jgi:hypothetical protein
VRGGEGGGGYKRRKKALENKQERRYCLRCCFGGSDNEREVPFLFFIVFLPFVFPRRPLPSRMKHNACYPSGIR